MAALKRTLKVSLFNVLLCICSFLSGQVYARWLSVADAPTRNSYIKEININGNGSYDIAGEINKEILTEVGRSGASNIVIQYNGDNEKIEILEAKTIRDGKEYFLDKSLIEDKPLASSYDGFDQRRQIFLVFPKVEKGVTLHVKYKFIAKEPSLENFFAETFYFGDNGLTANTSIKITSKLPLYILVNDPKKSLKIKKYSAYKLDIILTKPVYDSAINEPEPTIINDKYLTWVSVSSLNDWKKFAIKYENLWASVLAQKVPEDFEKIIKTAGEKNSEIEKINTVTSQLNNKIRYMGDWRSINGRFVPRDLDKISKTQIGDCKDFSAATAAILAKLGFRVQFVVVRRGVDMLSRNILPSFEAFNHTIIRATGKNGMVYWVDPTNFESMADGIFPDIANKIAIILDPNHPDYVKIPSVDFNRAKMHLKRQWNVMNNDKINEVGELYAENEVAMIITGGTLKASADVVKNALFYFLADNKDLDGKNKKHMNLPNLDSRIVKNISLTYNFERKNQIFFTNTGSALKLAYTDPIAKIYNISQDYVSDILIDDFPRTRKRQTVIKNIDVQNIEALNKEIKTPWIYVKRKCVLNDKRDLQIEDTIITYKNLIPNEDIKKIEFLNLRDWLENNFKDVIIIFDRDRHSRSTTIEKLF